MFFHFGIRTFNEGHKDWDLKPMEHQLVNHVVLTEETVPDCEIESFDFDKDKKVAAQLMYIPRF